MPDIEHILDLLEEVRNFLNEAPIDELETIESALGRNAPVHQIAEAINEIWKLSRGYVDIALATNPNLKRVLECDDETSGNGRSPWYWIMMPNGDRMLATYPQGDLYLEIF